MNLSVPLKLLPEDDRPREKLLRLGAEALTDAELLAILLRTGVPECSVLDLAQKILHHCGTNMPGEGLAALGKLRESDFPKIAKGFGRIKWCSIAAAIQLGQRAAAPTKERVDVSNPDSVWRYLAPRLADLEQEEFLVILVNAKNHVLDVESVSRGTLTASLVHPREVFRPAVKRSAHAVILAHNHPSGDPKPSREDLQITQRLVEAGKLMGIEVLDHVVIGKGRYVSLRAERRIPEWS